MVKWLEILKRWPKFHLIQFAIIKYTYKSDKKIGVIDRQTDRRTDRRIDRHLHFLSCFRSWKDIQRKHFHMIDPFVSGYLWVELWASFLLLIRSSENWITMNFLPCFNLAADRWVRFANCFWKKTSKSETKIIFHHCF